MKIFPKKWVGFPKYLLLILFAFFFTNLTPDPQQYLDNKFILNLSLFLRLFSSIFLLWGLGGLIYETYKYIINKVFRKSNVISEKIINKIDTVNQKNIILKPNKYFLYGILFCLIFILGICLFINSKLYIKNNFNKAFTYRITGDCKSFVEFIYPNDEEWKDAWLLRCFEEKNQENEPIRKFTVNSISHKFFSNEAFLQVNLTRNNDSNKAYDYSANCLLKRNKLNWYISQGVK